MKFGNLEYLWFALTLPVIILFYLLKRKRHLMVVPSTLLWQRFLAETQANAPLQRLCNNWLMIIQLLMLALAILALLRPYFQGKAASGRKIVVILDASASMQSTDVSPSRFEAARKGALQLIDQMNETDEMVLLNAGGVTEVKQSSTRDKAVLKRALNSTSAEDVPTRLSEALKLVMTLIQNTNKAEIHLFSDGAVPNLSEFEQRSIPLSYHRIGERSENAGIINMDVRANPENPSQRALFVTVGNYGSNSITVPLEVAFEKTVVEVKAVTIPPRKSASEVFFATQEKDGVFRAKINRPDDLMVDNEASVVSLLPRPVRVLLVTPGNRFLEKALHAVPGLELNVQQTYSSSPGQYDVVVLDRAAPNPWPNENVLLVDTLNPALFGMGQPLPTPSIVDWKGNHPLLRFVTFDNVQISAATGIKTPPWATSLLDSPSSPLLLAGEVGHQRIVWVGFDLLQSTWPLRISFPIFVANATEWLNPATIKTAQLNLKAGQALQFASGQTNGTATITFPDGHRRDQPVDSTLGEVVFAGANRVGVYTLEVGESKTSFCMNLLDAAESDTQPRDAIQMGQYTKIESSNLQQANVDFWRWVALTGLFVLMFEWWFYHKRTA